MKYISAVLSLLLFSCGSGDDSWKEMRVMDVDVADFHIYRGSTTGAVEYKYYETVAADKVDSLRSVLINKYLSGKYDKNMYSDFVIEFNGSKLNYTFQSGYLRKTIADYRFEGDSLFALNTDTTKLFVALGTQQNDLYRMHAVSRYPFEEKDTIVGSGSTIYSLDKVLDMYGKELTNPEDTIVWLNAKYLYK